MYMNAIYSAKQACKVDMQARIQCSCKSNSCTLHNTLCSRLCKDELAAGTGAPLKAKRRRSLWAALASWVVARANGTGVAILVWIALYAGTLVPAQADGNTFRTRFLEKWLLVDRWHNRFFWEGTESDVAANTCKAHSLVEWSTP